MSSSSLIVGLGNPGREYATTRHNVGWMALAHLMGQASQLTAEKKKFQGEFAKGSLTGHDCIFLRPETFMNESGKSVQPAMAFFQVAPRQVIVLHDELDLPFGEVRVKLGGGHAGHNGLRSLIQHLGTPEFVRVRLGIGRPPAGFGGDVADFVLASFDALEKALVPDMIEKGARAVLQILTEGVERAMNDANVRPKKSGGGGQGQGEKKRVEGQALHIP